MIKPLLSAIPLFLAAACAQQAPALEVRDAWARATAPGQTSGAVYATLDNRGPDDRLTGAATDRAAMAMIHKSETVDGVARMRMAGDVPIASGSTVVLAPGGTHILLEGLKAPLVAGETLPLELRFANGGAHKVDVRIVAPWSR